MRSRHKHIGATPVNDLLNAFASQVQQGKPITTVAVSIDPASAIGLGLAIVLGIAIGHKISS